MKISYIITQIKKIRLKSAKKSVNMLQLVNEAFISFIKEMNSENFPQIYQHIKNVALHLDDSLLAFNYRGEKFYLRPVLPTVNNTHVIVKAYQLVNNTYVEITPLELTVSNVNNNLNIKFNTPKTINNHGNIQQFQDIQQIYFASYFLVQLQKYLLNLP